MLTLSDINTLTNSKDGDIFSDCYKDVHGFRPRYIRFNSIEHFDECYTNLCAELSMHLEEDRVRQIANLEKFAERVRETMELCNCDSNRAIEIIADAEGELEEYKWYGLERLEWHFDLKYGSIKQWLQEAA